MVAVTDRINALFADARDMHRSALARLEAGDVRDAAEKAWCAAKRATDALILARTGEEPFTTAMTSDELDRLRHSDPEVSRLQGRYYSRLGQLHGRCFYDGVCNPDTERRIRETSTYIYDAQRMAIDVDPVLDR